MFAGHRRLHQEGVRQEVQPDLALHRGPQLRLIRDSRDSPLYLLLSRTGGHSPLQKRLDILRPVLSYCVMDVPGASRPHPCIPYPGAAS